MDIDNLQRAIARALGVNPGDVEVSVTHDRALIEVRAVVETRGGVEYRGWDRARHEDSVGLHVPWTGTGYGVQTALFIRGSWRPGTTLRSRRPGGWVAARSRGMECRCSPPTSSGATSRSPAGEALGWRRRLGSLVIFLGDVWPLQNALFTDMNLAAWVPIDHDPSRRRWSRVRRADPPADRHEQVRQGAAQGPGP